MNAPKTKIAIISQSLGGGGAERFAGLLSFMLVDLGYDVHNIIVDEPQNYDYKGALLNLGALYGHETGVKRRFYKMVAMKHYLDSNEISIIIDNRTRNTLVREWLTRLVYSNRKIYYLIHSFNLENYLPLNIFLAKRLYQNAAKLICVSKAIEEKIIAKYHFKNTVTIYNPINPFLDNITDAAELPEKYILFFGRFQEKVKNFSLMLEAFARSEIYEKGYVLLLMGEGKDLGFIQTEIAKRNLIKQVKIIRYQKNPFGVVKKSRYTILTSQFEGFPMSICESLALGIPVIAVDCNSGPRELIINEQNGLLVENYNAEAFAIAIKRLIDDEKLYQTCKLNASKSVAHLSLHAISKKWKSILLGQSNAI